MWSQVNRHKTNWGLYAQRWPTHLSTCRSRQGWGPRGQVCHGVPWCAWTQAPGRGHWSGVSWVIGPRGKWQPQSPWRSLEVQRDEVGDLSDPVLIQHLESCTFVSWCRPPHTCTGPGPQWNLASGRWSLSVAYLSLLHIESCRNRVCSSHLEMPFTAGAPAEPRPFLTKPRSPAPAKPL